MKNKFGDSKMIFNDRVPVEPKNYLCIDALDGYETYKIDENTIGVRPKWIEARKKTPRKDIPILILTEFCEMPDVVIWLEDGTYGQPGFFESNNEYEIKEEDITYWMPAPEPPND
jgi:hypothetical protein